MQPHILTILDDSIYQQLLQLAAAAGLHIAEDGLVSKAIHTTTTLPDVSQLSREEMLAIIRRGGDGKSIPDPLAWQREERDWDDRLAFPQP
ncbi:hypothetical protein [uncultured Hymenobacter sp.]|uniref:hypothetical protein n=1 Tax=uncultured Hymenobacter sp. TaxID=170016 RepID=UPI0035CB1756